MSESSELDDIVREFLVESYEGLDRLDRDLILLEDAPSDRELVARIFRCVHTIKGTCGFLGFSRLESVTHVGESLLARLRDGSLGVSPELTSVLLSLVDAIRTILASIETTGGEGDAEYEALIAELSRQQAAATPAGGGTTPSPVAAPDGKPSVTAASTTHREKPAATPVAAPAAKPRARRAAKLPAAPLAEPVAMGTGGPPPTASRRRKSTGKRPSNSPATPLAEPVVTGTGGRPPKATRPRKSTGKRDVMLPNAPAPANSARPAFPQVGELLVEAGYARQSDVDAALQEQSAGRNEPVGEILVKRGAVPAAALREALEMQSDARAGAIADTTIRVDVGLLDRLMNLVGELVLTRNQIQQHAATAPPGSALGAASQRLTLLASDLQEGVMRTRMQPIGNVWSKFPRVVRDLAVACNKQIRLDMEGRETELDKTIIEAIRDPLTHIVRNAADHGIELPAERLARGKPAEGRLTLRAYHEGGQVHLEVSDDGAGLNPVRLKQKAIEKGLITADEAGRLGDREALGLIFLPGFSLAASVTRISGRGVGMDVVRTNIERIGGVVDVQSRPGEGTTLKIRIPLTLAIIPALVISSNGERYAIPQVNLVELVRQEARDGGLGVEYVHDAPVYRLRGDLLPLVFLRAALGLPPVADRATDDALNIVVLHAAGRTFGVVVDDITDTEEIVVKPVSKHLYGVDVFSGATIMGDGRVALIIDALGLAVKEHVISAGRDRAVVEPAPLLPAEARRDAPRRQLLLICDVGDGRRVALPLSSVTRLERFQRSQVEHASHGDVVQYRDGILPLLHLASLLDVERVAESAGSLSVVVHGEEGNRVGLVVGNIVDIIEESIDIERRSAVIGVVGSIVVRDRVTDLLDVATLLREAAPMLAVESLPSGRVA